MAKIGIDFGTSYSTVSYMAHTGEAAPMRINGKEKIPTMLYFPESGGEPLVGESAYAKYEACRNAKSSEEADMILGGIITDLKRNMSKSENIPTPGGAMTYAEVISVFFKYIKDYAEKHCFEGESVTDVCITYPVSFDEAPSKKDLLKEAAQKAGFSVVKLLKEPVAAAMGYSMNRKIRNQGILIYDFGGGTFDVAYVKFDHNGDYMIPCHPLGDPDCGGEDIDNALYETWDKMVYAEKKKHISEHDGEVYLPILKEDCMKQKELMSQGIFNKHILVLPSDIVRLESLSESCWNEIISPWIDKTISLTRRLLEEVALYEDAGCIVDKVILIGGSSRIPQVMTRLREICPVEPMPVQDVDVAVANGAAIYANMGDMTEKVCYCIYDGCKLS